MVRSRSVRRRSFHVGQEAMERREMLSGATVLFTPGDQASRPTEWGIVPADVHSDPASFFRPSFALTKDAFGNPIDFNKDGLTDLVQGGTANSMVGYYPNEQLISSSRVGLGEAYLADPNGGFKVVPGTLALNSVNTQHWGRFAVLDLNSDGYQDVLSFTLDSKVDLHLYNPSTNRFTNVPGVSTLNHPFVPGDSNLSMGDVNGDGLPDLALPDYDGGDQLLGFSIFLAKTPAPGGTWGGEFEPDAHSIVTLGAPIPILNNANPGLGPGNVQPLFADLNGHGKLDMVIPDQTGITVFTNPGDGSYSTGNSTLIHSVGSVLGFNLQAGDFNNDGKTDLVSTPNPVSSNMNVDISPNITDWAGVFAPVSVYLNTTATPGSAPTFNVVSAGPTDEYLGSLQLGDFNLDGNLDIGVSFASRTGTTFAVGSGDGQGGFDTFKNYVGYTSAADGAYGGWARQIVSIGVGDFNGDHQLDVVATAAPFGSNASTSSQDLAVGIAGVSYNHTFAAPGATPVNPAPAFVGLPYSLSLIHTGGDNTKPYTFTLDPRSVPLPRGLTMSTDGVISGTPSQSGPFQLLIHVTQPNGLSGSSFVYLNVEAAKSGTITPGTIANAVAGVPYQQPFTASGGPASWAVTFGGLPPGLALSSGGVLSGTPTATGQYDFQLTASGNGFITSINYNLVVQASAAPIVTSLARYGYHNQPTYLTATFSQAMNQTSAESVGNYTLVSAGRDGRLGTRDDVSVGIRSAAYDSATMTVTLSPVSVRFPLRGLYRLTINGTPVNGLAGNSGTYLGGQGIASPGTNYVQVFGSNILAGPAPIIRGTKTAKAKVGGKH